MKKTNQKPHPKKLFKYSYFLLYLLVMLFMSSCKSKEEKLPIVVEDENKNQSTKDLATAPTDNPVTTSPETDAISTDVFTWIDKTGTTMDTRIHVPGGFSRIPSVSGELTGFLRSLPLKEDGSDVLLYDGNPKGYQDGHIAVFDLDVGDRDLQQCADSVIRIYAEYYWSIGAYDKIAFHLTNGFLMEYTKWREGNRLVVNGNDVSWSKTKSYDDSYETFRNYLDKVFTYAGTLSLSEEADPVTLEEMQPGDMFIKGGSPGHCVLVVDAAEDKDGNRCYLLAQGYMPAQDFHILKNPLHPEDPWYYTSEISFPIETPQWTFDENSLVRWGDFPLNEANAPLTFDTVNNTAAPEHSPGTNTGVIPVVSDDIISSNEDTPNQVTLLAVGDNLIHEQVIQSGKQADGTYKFDHLYSNLKDEISAADIAIINQETILGGDLFPYSGYPSFNSPTEIGDAIVTAGFDVVLHATNHTMDRGLKAVQHTFEFWEQYPQITVLGINETKDASEQVPIVEKNGIKIAMLNYTYGLNGYSTPDDMPYLVNMLDKNKMAEDIQKAEELADFTIVFPHWGTEYKYEPSEAQKELTEFFYEQGVDLIIGTHPHVLEPVEWFETQEDHRMLVYYSLGNFMSYQKEAPRMLGGIANVTITKDDTGTYISNAEIIPTVTHFENGPADFHYAIYELDDYTSELADAHGVSELAQNGVFTYQGTFDLAKQILGYWY
jgi:poly-gamma-glutamate capsule biosynthesis protein CapA/YwtB (metallophosphatase superfamily)